MFFLIAALLFGQEPPKVTAKPPTFKPPVAQARHRPHGALATPAELDLAFACIADLSAQVDDLTARVKAAEAHRCRCQAPVAKRPDPKPMPDPKAPAPAPQCCWRLVDGVWLYGYQDGDVFRYTHYQVPALAAPGCAGGQCGR